MLQFRKRESREIRYCGLVTEMSKRLLLCRKFYRGRHGASLIDTMKIGWESFLRRATAKRFAIFGIIGLAILFSATVFQGISLHKLKTLNEVRASLVETRSRQAENDTRVYQILSEKAELIAKFLPLRERVIALEDREEEMNEEEMEEMNKAKALTREIEIELEEHEERIAATQALGRAIEAHALAIEGTITLQEQIADCDWRIFGLLLSIGMLFFTYGLAVWIYNLSRERA